MQGEEQKAYMPKLSIKGENWVMYLDRILWVMKQNQIKEHITANIPPTTYISKGTIGSITPQERWECEEHTIRMALENSMPDEAFNQIKDTESVRD
jgi:hypothetical protein